MLRTDGAGAGDTAALTTRLIVEPLRAVAATELPAGDPERAAAHAVAAGIPTDLLTRFGATVRQTHQRANVIVLDVPADQQAALAAALRARGIQIGRAHV